MTTAYLIDPARRTLEPVTYSDIADLQQLLDCSMVGTGGWFDSNHLILVDDNGLFDRPARHFCGSPVGSSRCRTPRWWLAPIVRLRTAPRRREIRTIPIETVRRMVEWLSRHGLVE